MSRREPLEFSSPLGPEERLPAASRPVVVDGLTRIKFGRKGRFFSRRRSCSAAATSSRWEAISGRLFTATRTSSSALWSQGTSVTWRNGGSIGSISVVGSRSRTSASWALATCQSRIATCWVCRRLWSSVWARLISRGAIRLGASPVVKFTSRSARWIDAPMPSSRPRAACKAKKACETWSKHIVPRRLEIGPARLDHPTRRQRGEDGVGEPDGQRRTAADEERLAAFPEVLAGEDVLLDAVVPEVVDAGVEVGDPEGLGLEMQGERLLDLGRRRGDVQRPDPGQRQGGREVDRQAAAAGPHPCRRGAGPPPPGRGWAAGPTAGGREPFRSCSRRTARAGPRGPGAKAGWPARGAVGRLCQPGPADQHGTHRQRQ